MKNLIFLLLISSLSYSQSISKQVIGTSGMTQSNSNFKLSWTVGEPVVELMTAGGNQLGNGYYPALDIVTLGVEDSLLELHFTLYPNPTSELLYVTHPELNSFIILITDLGGKQVYTGTIIKDVPLNLSNYTTGIYLVTIESPELNKKNTYKVVKQ